MPDEDALEIVDDADRVIGKASRTRCHGDPSLVHRAAHVLVFNHQDELLLQKRADDKLIQPGRWDSSVGGHLDPGESYRQAAIREMGEELGLVDVPLTLMYHSTIRNKIESENVATFFARHDGPFNFCRREISEISFWRAEEIERELGSGLFTPNLEDEWARYKAWSRRYPPRNEHQPALCAGETFPDLVRSLHRE